MASPAYKSSALRRSQYGDDGGDGVPAPPPSALGTAIPSRDSVSAAIALVRAKQAAKAGGKGSTVHKVSNLEELKQLRPSNKVTSAQQHLLQQQQKHRSWQLKQQQQREAAEKQQRKQQQQQHAIAQSENAKPTANLADLVPLKTPSDLSSQAKQNAVAQTLFAMVNDVFSSRSEAKAPSRANQVSAAPIRSQDMTADDDLFDPFEPTDYDVAAPTSPRRSSERMARAAQTRAAVPPIPASGTAATASAVPSTIPDAPSMKSEDGAKMYEPSGFSHSLSEQSDNENDYNDDNEDLPEVDEKTIEEVNTFLEKIGVGASASKDQSIADSIEKMRMLSSSVSGGSGADDSTIGEVEPETMAEISAFIDNITKKDKVAVESAEEEKRQARDEENKARIQSALEAYEEVSRIREDHSKRRHEDAPSSVDGKNDGEEDVVAVKQVRSDDSAEAEIQVRTSRPSPIYELLEEVPHGSRRDPPSTLAYEGPVQKADPPGPPTPPSPASISDAVMQMHQEGDDMLVPSFSVESLDSSPPASVAIEEEKKSEDDEDELGDEEFAQYIDTSFAASVRKTLSTVVEAASADEEEARSPNQKEVINLEDYEDEQNYDNLLLEALDTTDEASPRHAVPTSPVPASPLPQSKISEEEYTYGTDGRREPKGEYEMDDTNVEEIAQGDDAIEGVASSESADMDPERYVSLEQDDNDQIEVQEEKKELKEWTFGVDEVDDSSNEDDDDEDVSEFDSSMTESDFPDDSFAPSEDDSAAWALQDIASEETMRATGRTRRQFVLSGRRPSKKSRVIASLLSDDTSVQQSEVINDSLAEVKEAETEEEQPSDCDEEEVEGAGSNDNDEATTSESNDEDKAKVEDTESTDTAKDDDVFADNGRSVDGIEVFFSAAENVDDIEVVDEGVEITAPDSLVGKEDDSDNESEDQQVVESVENHLPLQAPSDDDSGSQVFISQDPSGHLGRSVDSEGHQIRKPDPEALKIKDLVLTSTIDFRNKRISVHEIENSVGGNPVIHVLTEESEPELRKESNQASSCGLVDEELLPKDPSAEFANCTIAMDETFEYEEPAFEVGQGALSPTKVSEFVSKVDRQRIHGAEQKENVKQFKKLIVPLVDGHKPTMVESARIRQAAIKADISLDIVDRFLDYVNDEQLPDVSPAASSADEHELFTKSLEVEDINEDEAIAEFLGRVEKARILTAQAVEAAAAAKAAKTEEAEGISEQAAELESTKIPPADENGKLAESAVTFLEQFKDLQLEEEEAIETVQSDLHVNVLPTPTAQSGLEDSQSCTETFKSVGSIEVQLEPPAFEVGQGVLSPTRLSEFLAIVDHQHGEQDGSEELEVFKALILPIVNGHNPSLVEVAQIRQAAVRAKVPLNLVDTFLDYVNEEIGACNPISVPSLDEDRATTSIKDLDIIEDHNNDEAIAAFLTRVEQARVAAEEAAVALEAEAMAALEAKAALEAQAAAEAGLSNPFIRSFEELDLKDEIEHVAGEQEEDVIDFPTFEVGQGVLSPTKLGTFFAELDKYQVSGKEEDIKIFQKLMVPVANGEKPTVIEEARIRQAAMKADVPLDLVDTFLGYVKNDHPEILSAGSSKDNSLLMKTWDEVEDVNEDEAIAGFLQRFQKQKKAAAKKREAKQQAGTPQKKKNAAKEEKSTFFSEVQQNLDGAVKTPKAAVYEEAEAWWKHAGSPKNANAASFTTTSEEWGAVSTDLTDTISEDKPQIVESTKRHPKDLSIATDFYNKKSKFIKRFDEDLWRRRAAMATYGWGWEEATWLSPRSAGKGPVGIDGVTAAEGLGNFMFNKNSFVFARRNWKLSYKQRTKGHSGYFDVDVNSLQECATFGAGNWPQDDTPWELRFVRQRFLHERSLTFSRNWFGTLKAVDGNDKIKAPVCRPKSMEMPMENIAEEGQWDVEWYTTWSARRNMPKPPPVSAHAVVTDGESSAYASEDGSEDSSEDGTGSYTDSSTYMDEDEWEDAPECGTLVNVKQKIGERVSRVHPDYTSSLRRSRWRKKYFPRGTFPY